MLGEPGLKGFEDFLECVRRLKRLQQSVPALQQCSAARTSLFLWL